MDQGPLVAEQIDGGAAIAREATRRVPLRASCWVKEEGRWRLYLVVDEDDDPTVGAVNDVVYDYEDQHPEFGRWPVSVKSTVFNKIAKAAVAAAGDRPVRRYDDVFGGRFADEVYVYPRPEPAAAR